MYKNLLLLLFIFAVSLAAQPGNIIDQYELDYKFSTGLTFDGENLWVADYKADKLVALNPDNGEKVREIKSPGFWPMGLAWDGSSLWNIDKKQNTIFKVDPKDGTILGAINAPSGNAAGLAWDGNTLWVSDSRSKEIMKIDLNDGTAVETFRAPASRTHGLAFDGTYLWCADRIQDELYMVDPSNGEVIIVVDSPGPFPRGLAFDGGNLWNVDYEKDSLYQIVRKDDIKYTTSDVRKAEVTFTHQVKPYGDGLLKNLDVYIAVPQSSKRQKILNKTFYPEENEMVYDKWDQEFMPANYTNAKSGEVLETKMIVNTEISKIDYYIFPDECGTLKDIPEDVQNLYTSNGSKYKTDNSFIQKKVKEIVGEEQNPYWIARKIFDYVRNTLEYELVGGWNTAPVVLQRGTGSCSEYTFSFISLCRAAGVPARYEAGIMVRGDDASLDDVYHRWPEVYLPNYGWIPMDPQAGDDPVPRDRAMALGHLSNRALITTVGAGDSKYMGWYYNSHERYTSEPQVKVNIENFAEWEPAAE